VITGPEEPFGALEEARVMVTPLHTVAGAEVLDRARPDLEQVLDHLVGAGQVHRSVRVGQASRLLVVQIIRVTTSN